LFDVLNQQNPCFRDKLEAVEGDLTLPELGISPEQEKRIINQVNVIFHSAATVRFDEPLK